MASALQLYVINNAIATSKQALNQMKPILDSLNVLCNGSPPTVSFQQSDLDGVGSLSGLTVQQMTDAIFALTQVKAAIDTGFTALSQLAARG